MGFDRVYDNSDKVKEGVKDVGEAFAGYFQGIGRHAY